MFSWKKKREDSSSCGSRSRRSRDLLLLLAGLALTLTSIFLVRQKILAAERELQRKVSPVEIVVPAVPLQAGDVFSEKNLAKRAVPSSGTSARNVPAAEFDLLLGGRAKGNLSAGEPILWTDVEEPVDTEKFSQVIPTGRRAITFESDISSSFAGLLRPGDRVDLLCERENGNRAWMRSISVISVNRHFGRIPTQEEARDISTITVSVTPAEGSLLATVARKGHIYWFLRNPNEPSKATYNNDPRSKPATEHIEIWKAGVQELLPPPTNGEPG